MYNYAIRKRSECIYEKGDTEMKHEQVATMLFEEKYHCSQAVLGAFVEEFDLDIKTALKLGGCFGGGMCKGEVCGACIGALMALGLKYGQCEIDDLESRAKANEVAVAFLEQFKTENGSYLCKDLLGCDLSTPEGKAYALENKLFTEFCPKMVGSAVRIAEKLMEKDSVFFEKLSFHTHPCLSEEAYDGWLLRFAEGYTKRANSVNVVGKSEIAYADKIKYCEEKYAEHNLPTVFKITPVSQELDALLEERGYSAVDKTNVMTVDLTKATLPGERRNDNQQAFGETKGVVSVTIEEKFTESWQYYYFTFNKVSPISVPTAKKIQAKITNPVLCATVYVDKKAVACGLGVMEQGYVGLLDIVVKEEYRGYGFGKVLCGTLLEKAKGKGATAGYLQVVDSNAVAKGLYKGLGFEEMYSYWYRVK